MAQRIRGFGGSRWIILAGVFLFSHWTGVLNAEESPPNPPSDQIELGISEYTDVGVKGPVDNPITALDEDKTRKSTADHTKYKELQGPFTSGPEVTKACLECHNKAGDQFIKNRHWTWSYKHPITGQQLGKDYLVNNFCTNARGNEGMCAQCHAGFNRKGPDYDLTKQENIDCLVCHDGTGTYYKLPPTRGNKACAIMFEGKPPIDWVKVAQNVRLPGRANCGNCHFFGGGGDNVKHGDLSSVLFHPPRDVDVHMSEQGENFACIICHVGEGHEWAGSRYLMIAKDEKEHALPKPGMERETATCESCHGDKPHPMSIRGFKLNDHVDRVACESCHIPATARGGVATKIFWDWRTAGRLKNGEGYREEGYVQGNGEPRHTYKSIKGSFKYDENFPPVYRWFDGVMKYTTIDTVFDPNKPVEINYFGGSPSDPDSRIWPFKRMHTVQPYDKGNNTLVYMHLWGDDDAAFWGNYNFAKAIEYGMKEFNIPYSGEYGFIDTWSWWPQNHMVAPKEKALDCDQCHSKHGRLAELKGFYMPGRDSHPWLDWFGLLLVGGTLAGVGGHGLLRIFLSRRKS